MALIERNVLRSIRDWQAEDKNDLKLYDILESRVKNIRRRIEAMNRYTPRDSRQRETVDAYIRDCQRNTEDYKKKMKFCCAYGEWDEQQEAERRSEAPTSRAETKDTHMKENDECRRDIEENRKQTEQNRKDTEQNKKDTRENDWWDFMHVVTGNKYLVRDPVREM